jgi:hypothetical protein
MTANEEETTDTSVTTDGADQEMMRNANLGADEMDDGPKIQDDEGIQSSEDEQPSGSEEQEEQAAETLRFNDKKFFKNEVSRDKIESRFKYSENDIEEYHQKVRKNLNEEISKKGKFTYETAAEVHGDVDFLAEEAEDDESDLKDVGMYGEPERTEEGE